MKIKYCPDCKSELMPWIEIDQVIGHFCPECDYVEQTHRVVGFPGEHYSVPLDEPDLFDDMDEDDFILDIEEPSSMEQALREYRLNSDEEMPF